MPSKFQDSVEFAFRRIIRQAIRQGPFTKSEREVTKAIFEHWFHHKSGPKKYIHPSRARIAKKARCTEKTVSRTLGMLRASGILTPLTSLRAGQGKSVRYRVNAYPLLVLCGMDWVDELRRYQWQNVPLNDAKMSRYSRDKMSHCLTDVGHASPSLSSSGVSRDE